MTSTWSPAISLCGLALGCGLVVGGEALDDGDPIADDIAQYEQLAASLEADREQALDETVTMLTTHGPWLAWIDEQTLGLRRYPDRLELSLPPADSHRVGDAHVVTAEHVDLDTIYRGYALPGGEPVGEQSLPGLQGGLYTLLGDALLLLDIENHVILRWVVGVDSLVPLATLTEVGVEVEQLAALEAVVHEDDEWLVLSAGAWLWVIELSSLTAMPVAELDELLAASPRGILFTRADGLHLYEFDGAIRRIDTEIVESGWSLNPTFASIHEYTGDGATLTEDRVFYIGSAGVFAYALDQSGPEAISPILIEPRWDVAAGIPRIEYREPRFAAGTVFARGLTGPNGEIGEAGPIFAAPD
jgi:hypothetical protein